MEKDDSLILSIDQGTTSTKIAIINSKLKIVDLVAMEHEQITPNAGSNIKIGWTEHNPNEIYNNVVKMIEFLAERNQEVNTI